MAILSAEMGWTRHGMVGRYGSTRLMVESSLTGLKLHNGTRIGGGRLLCCYLLEQIQGGFMSIAYLMTWSLLKVGSSSVEAKWQLHSHQ